MSLNIRRQLITGPTVEPVTVDELKTHTVLDNVESAEHSYLQSLIRRARALLEHDTSRALVLQTWEISLTGFVQDIPLPVSPVRAIESITYINSSGDEVVVPEADYRLSQFGLLSRVLPKYGKSWPSAAFTQDAVRIRFTAGHANVAGGNIDSNDIIEAGPYELAKQAIMILAADWYANREDSAPIQLHATPSGFRAICNSITVDLL